MKLTGKNRSTRGKTCPSATLSTTNPTWTDPGSNPGFRDGRPATNRLSHGSAQIVILIFRAIVIPNLINSETQKSVVSVLIDMTTLKHSTTDRHHL
jgi:hypothetical protein